MLNSNKRNIATTVTPTARRQHHEENKRMASWSSCIATMIFRQQPKCHIVLQSRGPYRSISGKKGFWPHLANGGKMARKMGKMARPGEAKIHVRPFSSPFRAGGPKWIWLRSTGLQCHVMLRQQVLTGYFGLNRESRQIEQAMLHCLSV